MKVGAFSDSCSQPLISQEPDLDILNVPFSSLLDSRQQSPPQSSVQPTVPAIETGGGTEIKDDGNSNVTSRCDSRLTRCSMVSTNQDFNMTDFKAPFAGGNTYSELVAFYLECRSAPQLKIFSELSPLAEQVGDISNILEAFETSMQVYDEMLNSLGLSDYTNN
jgi:autophagy-related protein 13